MAEAAFQLDFFDHTTNGDSPAGAGKMIPAKKNGLVKTNNLPARREVKAEDLPVKERALRDEKWLYCKLVYQEHQRTRAKWDICCENVAIRNTHLFPLLIEGGKHGQSALHRKNQRKWMEKLGRTGKEINWENKDALLNNWSGGSERKGDPLFWTIFLATYLNRHAWSVAKAREMAARRTRELNAFAIIPSASQVRYQVEKLNPLLVNNARLGPVWVREHMLSYISRDWSAVLPNQIWFADHRVFDFPIRVWDKKEQCWMAKRPWICVYFDAKSHYVISAQILDDSPNSWTVRNGLALGIAHYGRPDSIYVDHGKDFLLQGFGQPVTFCMNEAGTKIYEHSILQELGIGMTNSIPYNGRAKCVERFFKYVSDGFDKMFPGYLSYTPASRPEQAELYYKCENAHLLPNLNELCNLFNQWLAGYHNTPDNGKILEGKTPVEAFAPEKRLGRAPMSGEELFRAFLRPLPKLKKVQRGPSVFCGKKEYRGTDELWQYMRPNVKVMIKTDANDPEHVFAFDPNGKFICECKTKPQVDAFARTDEARKLLKSEQAIQRRQAKAARTMVLKETGGFEKLDPLTLYSLPLEALQGPANLKKIASKSSVKGNDHNPAIWLPKDSPQLTAPKDADETSALPGKCNAGLVASAPRLETAEPFREDRKAAEQQEFERKLDQALLAKKTVKNNSFELKEEIISQPEKPAFILKD